MKRFIRGESSTQSILLPESLDDYIADANPVRVVDVFVDELDLGKLGFDGIDPAATGRPSYHPAVLLKLYIYCYLNRIQSSRRLERDAQRNVEPMWLTGRLMPDFKTIVNFRKDNGKAIRGVCRQFVVLCQQFGLFSEALVAIDGAKFKAAAIMKPHSSMKTRCALRPPSLALLFFAGQVRFFQRTISPSLRSTECFFGFCSIASAYFRSRWPLE